MPLAVLGHLTLSTTGTEHYARMREPDGPARDSTNDLEIPEKIDGGERCPTTQVVATAKDADATTSGPLSDSDRELTGDVLAAFSQHPSVARSVKANPLRTPAAQVTSRRVAAMIREGVPVDALASATTHHLDDMYRRTGTIVWSPTYCEPAYDRLHSEWAMRRAQQRRLREQQAERSARLAEMREEVADDTVVNEVMMKYRCVKATDRSAPSTEQATTSEDVRREIDALLSAKGAHRARRRCGLRSAR